MDRTLTLFDLACLGVGSTVGVGICVLAGAAISNTAGPAVTVLCVIAAIALVFAGICFAEYSSRAAIADNAYVPRYVTVCQFVAFTIGWNLLLEYAISTYSVPRPKSNYCH